MDDLSLYDLMKILCTRECVPILLFVYCFYHGLLIYGVRWNIFVSFFMISAAPHYIFYGFKGEAS